MADKFERVLSDEEMAAIANNKDLHTTEQKYRQLEQSLLEKLADQKPVAWTSSKVFGHYATSDKRSSSPEWFKYGLDVPLYAHPAPYATDIGVGASAWQLPETAPKDQVFIGDFGYSWPFVAQWSGANGAFVIAQAAVGMFEGVYNDTYFENEWLAAGELKAWMPMPELSDDVVQPFGGSKTLTPQQKQKILDHVNKIIKQGGVVHHREIIDVTEWALLSENGFTDKTYAEWKK